MTPWSSTTASRPKAPARDHGCSSPPWTDTATSSRRRASELSFGGPSVAGSSSLSRDRGARCECSRAFGLRTAREAPSSVLPYAKWSCSQVRARMWCADTRAPRRKQARVRHRRGRMRLVQSGRRRHLGGDASFHGQQGTLRRLGREVGARWASRTGHRTSRKNERTSFTNSSGCSKAAKWPPRSGSFQ
jgi:hypothetical protein